MITRLVLRLPWFISVPAIATAAVVLAIGLHLVAGTYFERSFRDDADPLLGLASGGGAAVQPDVATTKAGAAGGGVARTGQPSPGQAAVSAPAATQASDPAVAVLVSEGEFVDGDPGHNGSGRARLIRGADGLYTLRLESFSVTNGPDLFVILSTDPNGGRASASAGDALDLGRLKATDGNVNYAVPSGVDPTGHRSVIIYCRAFRVVFAIAPLEAR